MSQPEVFGCQLKPLARLCGFMHQRADISSVIAAKFQIWDKELPPILPAFGSLGRARAVFSGPAGIGRKHFAGARKNEAWPGQNLCKSAASQTLGRAKEIDGAINERCVGPNLHVAKC